MKNCFKINAEYDIALVPFSPIYEKDPLEIRCQVFNDGADGETELTLKIDDEVISAQKLFVKEKNYGFAKWVVSMAGKAGKHCLNINGECLEFEVLAEQKPIIDGGFIMIGPPNDRRLLDPIREDLKSLSEKDWEDYITSLSKINAKCIVINVAFQYLNIKGDNNGHGDIVAHYPSKLKPKSDIASDDPIAAILSAAEKTGQKIFLGVGNQYGYSGTVEEMEEMYERYKSFTSFYGWYFALEFNMSKFRLDEVQTYDKMVKKARSLCPVKPILTSPFGFPSEECLEYLKTHDVFDIMMAQDCVGQRRLTIAESAQMHKLLMELCQKINKHLWANCEAFDFTEEFSKDTFVYSDTNHLVPRFRDGGMDGKAGYIQQIEAVRPYTEKIMTFMLSGFFLPPDFPVKLGGSAAEKQYVEYYDYYKKVIEK